MTADSSPKTYGVRIKVSRSAGAAAHARLDHITHPLTRAANDRAANGRRGEAQAGSERGAGAAEPTIVTLQLSAARCEARVEQQRTLRPRGVVKGPGCHAAARGRRGERGVRRLDEALYGSAVAGVCAG